MKFLLICFAMLVSLFHKRKKVREPKRIFILASGYLGDTFWAVQTISLLKKAYPDAEFFAVCVKDNPRAMEAERLFTLARENGFSARIPPPPRPAFFKRAKQGLRAHRLFLIFCSFMVFSKEYCGYS